MDREFRTFCAAVGRRIRELRLERSMTQEDMIEHGFDLRHYQRLEGGAPANLWTIWRLARAFRVSPRAVLPEDAAEGQRRSRAVRVRPSR